MTEAQIPDPISRPNSALDGFPYIIKLEWANARLERNAKPREHYERQFSVTPDRQTPESQQTPLIPLSLPDPVEELEKAKSCAKREAERLGEFYAGRVILRKEESEQYGVFGDDPAYWYSQRSHWEAEYEKLLEEYDKRKQLEARGRAGSGYAEALLLSPVQPLSEPASNDTFSQAVALRTNVQTSEFIHRLGEPIEKDRLAPGQHPQQPTPEYSSESLPRSSRSRKRSHTNLQGWEDEKGDSDETHLRKRQRKKMPDLEPTLKLKSVTKSTREPRQRHWRISKSNTKGPSKLKEPLAPRVLPWNLRPRHVISYRESGTRAAKRKPT